MKALMLGGLLQFASSIACLWIDGTTIEGHSRDAGGHQIDARLRMAMEGDPEIAITNKLIHSDDVIAPEEQSAVIAIAEGKYNEAISILRKLEEEGKNQYRVAANLGTSYELSGDLDQALHWIRESISRNPDSHMGTEWLHVLILEEKIRVRDSGDSGATSDFIAIPDRVLLDSTIKIGGKDYPVMEVREALVYQLGERMLFVKPKDRIVSEMLYDLAILEANTNIVESALGLFDLSLEYGFRDPELIEAKKREYSALIAKRERRPYLIAGACLLSLIGFLVFAYKRKWFFLSRKQYRKHKSEAYLPG